MSVSLSVSVDPWDMLTDLHKPATAATGGRVKMAGVKLWLAGIYFLVHAIFVA